MPFHPYKLKRGQNRLDITLQGFSSRRCQFPSEITRVEHRVKSPWNQWGTFILHPDMKLKPHFNSSHVTTGRGQIGRKRREDTSVTKLRDYNQRVPVNPITLRESILLLFVFFSSHAFFFLCLPRKNTCQCHLYSSRRQERNKKKRSNTFLYHSAAYSARTEKSSETCCKKGSIIMQRGREYERCFCLRSLLLRCCGGRKGLDSFFSLGSQL